MKRSDYNSNTISLFSLKVFIIFAILKMFLNIVDLQKNLLLPECKSYRHHIFCAGPVIDCSAKELIDVEK